MYSFQLIYAQLIQTYTSEDVALNTNENTNSKSNNDIPTNNTSTNINNDTSIDSNKHANANTNTNIIATSSIIYMQNDSNRPVETPKSYTLLKGWLELGKFAFIWSQVHVDKH